MPPLLAETQDAFRAALLDADATVPPDIVGRDGRTDAARFAVYRNNVAVSLIEALKARYPVCCRLVGDECFAALARRFIAAHPPRSPILLAYGSGFADFVAPLPPAQEVPYLADMALLENAWNDAYNAADATPRTLADLAALPGDRLADLRVVLHPALRLIVSEWPIASIWHAHQADGEPAPPANWHGENVLVARPDADVTLHCLPTASAAFVAALRDGDDLGTAASRAAAIDAAFDAAAALVELCGNGALIRLVLPATTEDDA